MTESNHIRVSDAMTASVRTMDAMASVKEAMRAMRDAGVSSLVVERRDEKDEFGLLVIADIASEVIAKNRSADRINVYEVMSKPVLTLPPDMNVKYAVRHLVRFGVSRALVVDAERKPLGMVTLRDLVLSYAGE
jgi:signal-transduction protein with cAMP-binding, CBS, and nucleotidyltransferase domain